MRTRSSPQRTSSPRHPQASQANISRPARLSAVDGKLLWWLIRYPLQSVDDLALALGVSAKTIYRHLARLTDEKLIECVTPSLGIKQTCRLYYLSNAGLLAAAAQEHADAGTLARTWNAHEQGLLRLLPRLSTLVRLQMLVNRLIAQAPSVLAYSGGRRADFTWYWIRDYRHSLPPGDSITCSADAALLLRRAAPQPAPGSAAGGAEYYSALLYLDPGYTGSHDHLLITQKLEAILRYRDSLLREQQIRQFPPVLVIVPTPRQRERWQQSAIEVAASLHTEPLQGAVVSLPLQEIPYSLWALSWQKLMAQAPCRLQELFVPLPREALPPGLLKPRSSASATPAEPKGRRILRGDFTGRAREMSLAPESQQQESTVIALLRLCLLQRHLDVLNLLYAHPLLATNELAILLDLQIDSVVRYLYELRRYACIEKYDAARETRWHLSPRGLRFIAAIHACALQDIAEYAREAPGETLTQRGLPRLKRHIQQTANLYAFFTALWQGARTQGADHALHWWEMGARCTHRYRDHEVWHQIRPGAFFAYQAGNKRLLAWLEWCEDGMTREQLGARMQEYAHYVRTREWAAAGLQTLPMLLIVASEKGCYQRVIEAAIEHLTGSGLTVRLAATASVARRGPFAAIWSQIIPAPSPGSDARKLALLDPSAFQPARPHLR